MIPAKTFKQKQWGETQERAVTSTSHHLPTDGYNLSARGQKEWEEISNEKSVHSQKDAVGLAQETAVERRIGTELEHLLPILIQWGVCCQYFDIGDICWMSFIFSEPEQRGEINSSSGYSALSHFLMREPEM